MQEEAIRRTLIDKRPEQLKMEFFLWSRAAVGQLIEHEYGIKLQVRSVGKYLARWGFTPQKPIRRAYEQSPAAVQAWLEGEYPGIAERARHEGAELHWGDETALVNTDVRGRSFAPAGQTPVAMTVGGTRQKLSMIATVTNRRQFPQQGNDSVHVGLAHFGLLDESAYMRHPVSAAPGSPPETLHRLRGQSLHLRHTCEERYAKIAP